MKDIRDYLKYYIGQPVWIRKNFEGNDVVDTLTGKMVEEDIDMFELSDGKSYKPILRKLESMSDDAYGFVGYEKLKAMYSDVIVTRHKTSIDIHYTIETPDDGSYRQHWTINFNELSADQFHYLLSRGFDLFGLIDAGLAIDKATIKS